MNLVKGQAVKNIGIANAFMISKGIHTWRY